MNSIINNKELIYNLDYITIVPNYDKEYLESIDYSIGNVYYIENVNTQLQELKTIIKNGNFKRIILVDYMYEYQPLFEVMQKGTIVSSIITKDLGSLSDAVYNHIVKSVFDLYDMRMIDKIAVIDKNWYDLFKNKKNIELINLDIPITKKIENKENRIGILSIDYKIMHNYFNQVSAASNINKYNLVLNNPQEITKDFCSLFNIKCKIVAEEDYILNNSINLYINFTDFNPVLFLKSMDAGIPCLIGNSQILDGYSYLKEMLVVKSDDNIDEISDKINQIIINKDKIISEYVKFRTNFSKKSLSSISKFVTINKLEMSNAKESGQIKLSVIVPVYNTSSYLEACLDSIYNARINSMEVIVVNDGSTDNSEEIIKQYEIKHPGFITYIKQNNHGLGNVRNVGLKHAKGKYIASIDSDDRIDCKFFKEAEKYFDMDVDVVICDWLSIPEESNEFETAAIDWIFSNINKYKGILYTTIMPSTCNKVFKKAIFDSINLKYAEGLKYEDLSLNPLCLLKARTLAYINKPYYLYNIRGNSIMRTKAGFDMIDILKMINDRIISCFDVNSINYFDEFKYYTYSWRIEEFIFSQLSTIKGEELKNFVSRIYNNIFEIIEHLFNSKIYLENIKKLKSNTQEFINNRNKAFIKGEKEFIKFIEKSSKNNNYIKITPPMIYYGEK